MTWAAWVESNLQFVQIVVICLVLGFPAFLVPSAANSFCESANRFTFFEEKAVESFLKRGRNSLLRLLRVRFHRHPSERVVTYQRARR